MYEIFPVMASQHKVFFGESERGCALEQSIIMVNTVKYVVKHPYPLFPPPQNPKPKQVRLEWLSTDNLSNLLFA